MRRFLEFTIAVSAAFALIAIGVCALSISADVSRVAAESEQDLQSTNKAVSKSLDNLNATLVDVRRTVLIASGTLNIVRDTMRKEQATTEAEIQSSHALVSNSSALVVTANETLKQLAVTVDRTLQPIPRLIMQTDSAR